MQISTSRLPVPNNSVAASCWSCRLTGYPSPVADSGALCRGHKMTAQLPENSTRRFATAKKKQRIFIIGERRTSSKSIWKLQELNTVTGPACLCAVKEVELFRYYGIQHIFLASIYPEQYHRIIMKILLYATFSGTLSQGAFATFIKFSIDNCGNANCNRVLASDKYTRIYQGRYQVVLFSQFSLNLDSIPFVIRSSGLCRHAICIRTAFQ